MLTLGKTRWVVGGPNGAAARLGLSVLHSSEDAKAWYRPHGQFARTNFAGAQ